MESGLLPESKDYLIPLVTPKIEKQSEKINKHTKSKVLTNKVRKVRSKTSVKPKNFRKKSDSKSTKKKTIKKTIKKIIKKTNRKKGNRGKSIF